MPKPINLPMPKIIPKLQWSPIAMYCYWRPPTWTYNFQNAIKKIGFPHNFNKTNHLFEVWMFNIYSSLKLISPHRRTLYHPTKTLSAASWDGQEPVVVSEVLSVPGGDIPAATERLPFGAIGLPVRTVAEHAHSGFFCATALDVTGEFVESVTNV